MGSSYVSSGVVTTSKSRKTDVGDFLSCIYPDWGMSCLVAQSIKGIEALHEICNSGNRAVWRSQALFPAGCQKGFLWRKQWSFHTSLQQLSSCPAPIIPWSSQEQPYRTLLPACGFPVPSYLCQGAFCLLDNTSLQGVSVRVVSEVFPGESSARIFHGCLGSCTWGTAHFAAQGTSKSRGNSEGV